MSDRGEDLSTSDEVDDAEPSRLVVDATTVVEVTNAVEGGVGIHHAAEAHRRMPGLKPSNVDTPSFQGHTFEQQATDAQNLRHPLHRWKINENCNEAATDATAADGIKLQMKKGYGQSDGPNTPEHQQGRLTNNRLIQKRALNKLDEQGHQNGKVVTTRGDGTDLAGRVEESPVSRARVEQATERYAQALKGLSGKDLAKLAGEGARRGALVGGSVSAGFAVYGLVTGSLLWDEAAEQVAVGTATAALGGAVGNVVARTLEAGTANAGSGAAVVAPKLGQVIGHAGIVGLTVSGVVKTATNGVAVAQGKKGPGEAARDTASATAFAAVGVMAGAGVATVGAVAAAPAVVTFLVVGGVTTAASVGAERGYKLVRGRLSGDPEKRARDNLTAAGVELAEAVAEFDGVTVNQLLDRISSEATDGGLSTADCDGRFESVLSEPFLTNEHAVW